MTLTGAAWTLLPSRLVAIYGETLRLDEMLTMQQRIADVPDTPFFIARLVSSLAGTAP